MDFCKKYYISNGKYCGNCTLNHIRPEYKICTPTYVGKICLRGMKCKFKHFLPKEHYCYNCVLFNNCYSLNCMYIHISSESVLYNLTRINLYSTAEIILDCVNRFYNDYFERYKAELKYLTRRVKASYEMAKFRTEAKCILCNSSADEQLTPFQRYASLYESYLYDGKTSLLSLPIEIIHMIRSYILPNSVHKNCYFLRNRVSDSGIYKLYERRLVKRHDYKKDIPMYVYRATEPAHAIYIYKSNIPASMYNISLMYDTELADIIKKYISPV